MVGERGQAEFNIDNSDMFKSYKILSIKTILYGLVKDLILLNKKNKRHAKIIRIYADDRQ